MRRILEYFGIARKDLPSIFDILDEYHNTLVKKTLKPKKLQKSILKETICEVKLFYYSIGRQIVLSNSTQEFSDKFESHFRLNFLFKDLNSSKYSEKYLSDLLNARLEFHLAGIQERNEFEQREYYTALYALWSGYAFLENSELKDLAMKANLMGGFWESDTAALEIGIYLKHFLPTYKTVLLKILEKQEF
jgi:hypothetical protein